MKILVIGRRLNVPVVAKSRGEVASPFRFLAPFVPLDNPPSRLTREQLGCRASQSFLVLDLDRWSYDETRKAA